MTFYEAVTDISASSSPLAQRGGARVHSWLAILGIKKKASKHQAEVKVLAMVLLLNILKYQSYYWPGVGDSRNCPGYLTNYGYDEAEDSQ